jgi:hypothetical protein
MDWRFSNRAYIGFWEFDGLAILESRLHANRFGVDGLVFLAILESRLHRGNTTPFSGQICYNNLIVNLT